MSKQELFPTFYAVGYLLRWMWRLIQPLLPVTALVLVAWYVILSIGAGRALEGELAQVRDRGEPLSLREAAPASVPDDENAAVVYLQAFQHLPRLVAASPSSGRTLPELSSADERVLRHLLSDRSEQRGNVALQPVREVLAGTDAALSLFRRAAVMPRCRFPVDWEAGAGALFPHYPKLVALARLVGAHAIVSAHDGDSAAAMADLGALVGLAQHLAGEPVLIGLLIQYQCLSFTGVSLERVLEAVSPTEAESRRLDQQLAELDLDGPFERAVETERCLGLWCFDLAARSDPAKLPDILGVDHPILWLSTRLGPLGRPLLRADEVFYLRIMARQVERANQRDRRRAAATAEAEPHFPWYAGVSRVILPALERVRDRRDETRARLALARWGLALSLYHQQTGRFPASLADAERTIGWGLPNDPLTGGDLVYHPQGSGYVLYSLGLNGQDDGGQNANDPGRRATTRPTAGQDDIAWRFTSEPGSPG